MSKNTEVNDLVQKSEVISRVKEKSERHFDEGKRSVEAAEWTEHELRHHVWNQVLSEDDKLQLKTETAQCILKAKMNRRILEWNQRSKQVLNTTEMKPSVLKSKYVSEIKECAKETLDFVLRARVDWESRLRFQIESLAVSQKRPLIREDNNNDESSSQESSDMVSLRYIYTSDDLLECISQIRDPNSISEPGWGIIQIELDTPDLQTLRMRYRRLHPKCFDMSGVSDWHSTCKEGSMRERNGKQVLERGYIPEVREFAMQGAIPHGIRRDLWRLLCGLPKINSKEQSEYFESLLDSVDDWDLITDSLLRLDVEQTLDNPDYFPFDDFLNDLILAFSRDPLIPALCRIPPNLCSLKIPSDQHSSVVPFHQQLMLAAPLCYLFQQPSEAYFVFRHLCCEYFVSLTAINASEHGLIPLCKSFERLSQYCFPKASFKCASLGVSPLSLVFPWLFSVFAGHLSVTETLQLWDLILAYHDLHPAVLLAVAIFGLRSQLIAQADTDDAVRSLFHDIRGFRVIPTLQHFLFTLHSSV